MAKKGTLPTWKNLRIFFACSHTPFFHFPKEIGLLFKMSRFIAILTGLVVVTAQFVNHKGRLINRYYASYPPAPLDFKLENDVFEG